MPTPEEKVNVIVSPINNNVIISPINNRIVVTTPGPQGAPGQTGGSYTHNQGAASSVWSVTHNLGYHPSITVVDSANTVVEGTYVYNNTNTVTLTFIGTFAGKAYLS